MRKRVTRFPPYCKAFSSRNEESGTKTGKPTLIWKRRLGEAINTIIFKASSKTGPTTPGITPTLTYSVEASTIAVHLFLGSSFTTTINGHEVHIQMETNLPWEDHVRLSITSTETIKLAVRIPSWAAKHYTTSIESHVRDGYLYIDVGGSGAIELALKFRTAPRFVYAHPTTRKDEVAVMRGPLVYCIKGVDKDFNLEHTAVLVQGGIKEVKKTDIAGIQNVPLLKMGGKVESTDVFRRLRSTRTSRRNGELRRRSPFCRTSCE